MHKCLSLVRFNLTFKLSIISSNQFYSSKPLPKEFDFSLAKKIEAKWKPVLEESQRIYSNNASKFKEQLPKKYILSMFPYPSGNLHLGHVRVYTLSDVFARYSRMKGFYVIHPIGWDSFGLPAENAAIERKVNPLEWTKTNIEYMKNQLKELSFSFDWNRELSTSDKSYYKWTQHIFLQLYNKGIIFQKEALVNWDPIDKTVLANEQIDREGRSWRSGSKVEKKILKQWFLKSSHYAKSLLDEMNTLDTEDWNLVKSIQQMWIGNCNGCLIEFDIKYEDTKLNDSKMSIFTQTPYAIYGISHIDVTKNNIILRNLNEKSYNENTRLKCYAVNPLNNQKIPIFINNDESLFGQRNADGMPNLDARIGVPSLHDVDKLFAKSHNLDLKKILDEKENLINSNELNGLNKKEAFKLVSNKLIELKRGGNLTSETLNDWCISRQRYWGTPIPLIYCDNCKHVPIPFEHLPVELPVIKNLSEKGLNYLRDNEWANVECPKCKRPAKRESDTMDTFFDSAWYFLRYLDVTNLKEPFDSNITRKEMPVDIYIGGAEHAMTHLFVSRLFSHFFYEQNQIECKEPFKRFVAIGMVKGETFKTKNGKYVPSVNVEKNEKLNKYYDKETNEEVFKDFEKMSKSKLNGADPQMMIKEYGVDFTRLFLLNFVHPRSDRNFLLSDDMINGTLGIFKTIWGLVEKACSNLQLSDMDKKIIDSKELEKWNSDLISCRNAQLSMIKYNFEQNFNLPSYIVAFTKIVKHLKKYPIKNYNQAYLDSLVEVLILISPVTPHFSSECWDQIKNKLPTEKFKKDKLITEQNWPEVDASYVNINKSKKSKGTK